jgi:hypothetical protein
VAKCAALITTSLPLTACCRASASSASACLTVTPGREQ